MVLTGKLSSKHECEFHFFMYTAMIFDKCTLLWNHHHNQDIEQLQNIVFSSLTQARGNVCLQNWVNNILEIFTIEKTTRISAFISRNEVNRVELWQSVRDRRSQRKCHSKNTALAIKYQKDATETDFQAFSSCLQ